MNKTVQTLKICWMIFWGQTVEIAQKSEEEMV